MGVFALADNSVYSDKVDSTVIRTRCLTQQKYVYLDLLQIKIV